ncbi:MAG TPA: hypothetical protein VMY37_10295 [Thermoguttaceae bacterium]|nr:hypothetical protein [Thermoguttaceae bacterium]
MGTGSADLAYRKLRAPQEDGAVLIDPPLEQVGAILKANRNDRRGQEYDLQGRSLWEVSREARRELLEKARQWTSQYRDVDLAPAGPFTPILLAGHQPQLFHPGVWLKNFALGALAREHGGVGVNLLIDSDTLKTPGVRVPGGSVARPHVAEIAMDRAGAVAPYEERAILDRRLFRDFGRRATDEIASLVPDPVVRDYWPMVVERMDQTDSLGACLAQSRHQLEGRWGLNTLEIPQSWVCGMRSHGWFVAHLLAQLPRLRQVYNEVVEEYRRVHRIRSRAHPVPNLAQEGPWLEAPFWIWTAEAPRRRRLFASHRRREIVLSDRQGLKIALPLRADGDARAAVDRLAELGREGIRIRCRALATTLWARLALGDLFLHGIGGAKYDQVTDGLIRRFFGLDPPGFLVLSATLHLPVDHRPTTVDQLRAIEHGLRELTYHPECYINGTGEVGGPGGEEVAQLVGAKARWIRTGSTAENARNRYREIRRINEALQPCVARLRERLAGERRETARALTAEAILSAREYAFCLFPESAFQEFLFPLLPRSGQIGSDKA